MSMMDTVIPFALLCFTSLFTITSPLSTMPVFLTMTQSLDEKERRAVAIPRHFGGLLCIVAVCIGRSVLIHFWYFHQRFPHCGWNYYFSYRFRHVASQVHPMNLRKEEIKEYANDVSVAFGNSFVMRAGGNSQCYRADAGSLFL